MVLFGGGPERQALDDTWTLNAMQWATLAVDGPPARGYHAMAYDAARENIVLFGGYDGRATLGDTWEWDGRQWAHID